MSIYEVNIVADLESFDYTGAGNTINVVTDLTSFNYSDTSATTEFEITSPTEGQQIPEGNFPITVTFDDTASPDGWRVQVATDSGFTNVVFDDKTITKSIQVDSLGIDVYYAKIIRLSIDTGNEVPIGDNSRAGDEESLQLLYDSLGGASWTDNTGWASTGMSLDDDIFGVETDIIDVGNGPELRVAQIDLEANNLIGTIPEFPALNECTYMRFKQKGGSQSVGSAITGVIPDSIGNNTKVTSLSLAGNLFDQVSGETVDFENPIRYSKKRGEALNQFTGGIPDSLYNLSLQYFEISGQRALEATLTSGVSNWDIRAFIAHSALFYGNTSQSCIIGDWPSESKNWVNCKYLYIADNTVDSFPLDMFEGWVDDAEREIQMGWEARGPLRYTDNGALNQNLPDMSHFTDMGEFNARNREWTGTFPYYLLDFVSLNSLNLSRNKFSGAQDLDLQNKIQGNSEFFQLRSDTSATISQKLSGNLFTGVTTSRNVIIFDVTDQELLSNCMGDGTYTWNRLRYYRMRNTGGGVLPNKPPAQYASEFRGLDASNSGLTGNITNAWSNIGSIEPRGGVIFQGTITGFGEDATGFYIEDDTLTLDINELPDLDPTPVVRYPFEGSSRADTRAISSNTSTRIYYNTVNINDNDLGFAGLEIGGSYFVERNANTNTDPFDEGIFLNNNLLSGVLPSGGAPTQMVGGVFNISNNNYTMSDFVQNIQEYIDQASSSGYTFTYSPQNKFGIEEVEDLPSGSDYTIDYSSFASAGDTYVWYKNNVVISGETTSILELTNITDSSATYRMEITNTSVPNFTNVSENTTINII